MFFIGTLHDTTRDVCQNIPGFITVCIYLLTGVAISNIISLVLHEGVKARFTVTVNMS